MGGREKKMEHEQSGGYRRFLLLWSGELISAIGGGLTSFGLGVYVFQTTGSAASMALVTLCAFLPVLVLSVPAGVLADRYDRLMLMMVGDGCSALGLIYLLWCMRGGGATLSQICIGVLISSVFSSLLEPSYRAVITDILPREEYSKASGMMSLAGSARYLISPLLAGMLLTVSDVTLLIWLDIGTFFLTVACTWVVRRGIVYRNEESEEEGKDEESLLGSFLEGWRAVTEKRGVVLLIFVSSVMTCFMGTMQILSEPMILDFQSSRVLGTTETICASGMLFSSVLIGIKGIKKGYVKVLSASLALAGLFMAGFGAWENIYYISFFGFMFFFTLPFANNCLDYLVRTNISSQKQGRAWGLIGLLSQLGYVVAYGLAGVFADLLAKAGLRSVGRGAAGVIQISGGLLTVLALLFLGMRDVRELEEKESGRGRADKGRADEERVGEES